MAEMSVAGMFRVDTMSSAKTRPMLWATGIYSISGRRGVRVMYTRGASALQDKFITVSSVANAGHDQLFAIYKDFLPFIRTQVVGDFTAARVNDSAWADGKLVLEETTASSLAKQADNLLAVIN